MVSGGGICVPVCAANVSELREKVAAAATLADLVEIRFDCMEKGEVYAALNDLPEIDKTYIFTYRPEDEGGRQELNLHERHNFWERVADDPPVSNFYGDVELGAAFPVKLRPDRTIASLHLFDGEPEDGLDVSIFKTAASIVKVAVSVGDAAEAVDVWKMLEAGRSVGKSVIPIAMGEAGKWTRILGLAHGAFSTYASLFSTDATAPGQITSGEMIETYRVRDLTPETRVYGIIAGNTSYSMSPYVHNPAFCEAAVDAVFVPFQTADLSSFMRRMVRAETREVELNFGGFSVTNPHKQAVLEFLDETDEAARAIGAVNTIKIEDDRLFGFNTDAEGFIRPLRERNGDLHGARAAVIGGGGAARAVIYALKRDGADVSVFTRRVMQGEGLAADFGVRCFDLENCGQDADGYDVVVNATPLGTRGEHESASISDFFPLKGAKLVYDLIYNPTETKLLTAAREAGADTIGGLEMLIGQAAEQFRIWTGREAPVEAMERAALDRLLLYR